MFKGDAEHTNKLIFAKGPAHHFKIKIKIKIEIL